MNPPILPGRHVSFCESVLGFGAFLLAYISTPIAAEDLWDQYQACCENGTYPVRFSLDQFIQTLDFLSLIGQSGAPKEDCSAMTLISLEAHQPPDQVMPFQNGLNVIVERRSFSGDSRPSSLLQLIRFCLGAGDLKPLADQSPDRRFTLTFQLDGVTYTITRGTAAPGTAAFCGQKMPVSAVQRKLLELCFGSGTQADGITWSGLISQFAPSSGDISPLPRKGGSDAAYQMLLHRCYLLGLDTAAVVRKKALWDRKISADTAEKALRENPLFRPYVLGERDADLDMAEIGRQLADLDKALSHCKVSADCQAAEKEVREIRKTAQSLENEYSSTQANIQSIEAALQETPQETDGHALEIYEAAGVQVPEWVKRRVEDVLTYHRGMQQARNSRLLEGLEKQKARLTDLDAQMQALRRRLDELQSSLDTHCTPEKQAALSEQRSTLQAERSCIQAYQASLAAYRDAALDRDTAFLAEERLANADLESRAAHLADLNNTFTALAKQFYPDRKCGLLIQATPGRTCSGTPWMPALTERHPMHCMQSASFALRSRFCCRRKTSCASSFWTGISSPP